jgi:1,4-alpha-glucan branching enzyme
MVRAYRCSYGFINLHRGEEEIFMVALETSKKIKESRRKTAKVQEVEFTFCAPEAKKVFIAGTFNDWNTKSMLMKKGKDGTWGVMIKLSPGRYEYKYFVDGAWAEDMRGADMVPNSIGTYNCVISVE